LVSVRCLWQREAQLVSGLDPGQVKALVVRPTLTLLGLWSQAAENLVLGTGMTESNLVYLKQVGGGPALGLFQCEPATHDDIWKNYLDYNPTLTKRVESLMFKSYHGPKYNQLVPNLAYATSICRVLYLRIPDPLPDANDAHGMAAYWKQYYNTPAGAG